MTRQGAAVAALAVGAFCFGTTESMPVGLLPFIAAGLDTSPSSVGLLVTGYGIVVAVVSVPIIKITVRIPRRPLLTAVMAVFVLMTWTAALAPGYGTLLGARLVTALAHALFWPAAMVAAAGLMPPEKRGRAASYVFAGGSLAIVLGVPAGTWLGEAAGWRASFAVLGVLTVGALVAVAALLPGGPPGQGHAATATAPDPRRFRTLVVVVALTVGGCFTAYTYISEFLVGVSGFAESVLSPLLLVNGLANLAGLAVAAAIVDRGTRRLLGGAALLMAAGLLVLYGSGAVAAGAIAGLVLLGLALSAFATSMQARVLETAPGNTDVASAWASGAFNVGIAGGALVGGLVLPVYGVRATPLVGAVAAGAAVLLICLDRLADRFQDRRATAAPGTGNAYHHRVRIGSDLGPGPGPGPDSGSERETGTPGGQDQ